MAKHTQNFLKNFFTLPILALVLALPHCYPSEEGTDESDAIPETAIVQYEGLKVRNGPNTMSAEVGKLSDGQQVKLLTRSPEKVKIATMEAHWYRIKTDQGLIGWVYGAYLDIESSARGDIAKIKAEEKEEFLKKLKGRWFGVTDTGGLLRIYIAFIDAENPPENDEFTADFEIGFGNKVSQYGQYNVELKNNKAQIQLKKDGKEFEKPLLQNIEAELRGVSMLLTADYRNTNYTFRNTDEKATTYREDRKAKEEKASGQTGP